MKNIFTRICWSLAICLCMNLMFTGMSVSSAEAATSVSAQQKAKAAKAKQAEKAKKAREAEKKKKAAAKKKEQAAKAKKATAAKSSRSAATKKTTSSKSSKPKPTREEIYEQQRDEVLAYNKRVSAYNARDIVHRLGFWGQIGYSAMFPANFDYNATGQIGFNEFAKGYVGGGGGVGYQLRYKRFLFTTGAEFQMYNSINGLYGEDKKQALINRSYTMQNAYSGMLYNYKFAQSQDMLKGGFVQIPLLFGMEFLDNQYYFLAGAKVGLNMLGSSQFSSLISTDITDIEASDPYINMPTHALYVNEPVSSPVTKMQFGLNAAAYAEIGMCLDRFTQPTPERGKKLTQAQQVQKNMRLRVALFAEYGVLNVQKTSNATGTNDMPAVFSNVENVPGTNPVKDLTFTSSLQTSSAYNAKLNPFMVGAKLTMFFDLQRKMKKLKKIPTEPNPEMAALVTNAETGQPIGGAQVTITQLSNGKQYVQTTNRHGVAKRRGPKGEYLMTAEKLGFFHGDTLTYTHRSVIGEGANDTVLLALQPEPVPIIYTYCGRIYAGDTQLPIEANVRITGLNDTTTLYLGQAADDGLFVTNLLEGDYLTHLHYPGYMDQVDTIHFVQDTLDFSMTKVKPGIRVRIDNLLFATGKTVILPQSEEAMAGLAQFLEENPTVSILIIGHTDNVGKARANQILSEGRANAVRRDLIQRGIDASRIEAEGRGMEEPIADNDTEEGRALNRRVEFMITDTQGEDIQLIKE